MISGSLPERHVGLILRILEMLHRALAGISEVKQRQQDIVTLVSRNLYFLEFYIFFYTKYAPKTKCNIVSLYAKED